MLHKLFIFAAWSALAVIVFVTLSPIGLRPQMGLAGIERFLAFGLLGALFVLAYPQHFVRVMVFVLVVAGALELLQHLTPDRHGHIADAIEKAVGSLAGGSVGRLVQVLQRSSRLMRSLEHEVH